MWSAYKDDIKKRNDSRVYNNPEYRHNSQLLKSLFKGQCIMCNKDNCKIEIHHNDRNRQNNDLLNLAHICTDCHKIVHMSNYKFEKLKYLLVQKLKFWVKCLEVKL